MEKGQDHNLEERSLMAFRQLYESLDQKDSTLEDRLFKADPEGEFLSPIHSAPFKIWHKELLKKHCLTQRVAIMPLSNWRKKLPYPALRILRNLESQGNSHLKGLFLLVPRPVVHPKEFSDRAILLARLSDGRYAELYSWGKPTSSFRKIWMWPLRNLTNSVVLIGTFAFLTAFVFLPDEVILGPRDTHSFMLRVVFFFYLILAIGGLSILYGFSKVKAFNEDLWKEEIFHNP